MKQLYLPRTRGKPRACPPCSSEGGMGSPRRSKGPWQLWQREWERGASL